MFASEALQSGSWQHQLLTVTAGVVIVACVLAFAVLLGFEVYRAFTYARAGDLAREAEVGSKASECCCCRKLPACMHPCA